MGYVCHTNKCCQSNSPKQYKNTDLFTQKEYSWPHWSHSNSSLLFFLLLWNQCYQDCYFWVKNQCYYIAFVSNFGNIYFCDKHDLFDVCNAARQHIQSSYFEVVQGKITPFQSKTPEHRQFLFIPHNYKRESLIDRASFLRDRWTDMQSQHTDKILLTWTTG